MFTLNGRALSLLFYSGQDSNDDLDWAALARAEMKAWGLDPATGHDRVERACEAYRVSIDLLAPGVVQVLSSRCNSITYFDLHGLP